MLYSTPSFLPPSLPPPLQLPLEAREALHSYNASVERNAVSRLFRELAGDFCPPGRCLYLKPTGRVARSAGWRRTKRRQYHAVFVEGSAVIDEGVLLSGRMMAGEVVGQVLVAFGRLLALL